VTFELHLQGYKKKTKQIVVGGNTTIGIELDPLPRGGSRPRRGSAEGLIRPGD
jgi:hypothetical protein